MSSPSPDLPTTPNLPIPLEFAPASLIRGEEGPPFEALLARVCATVRPASVLEEVWVREIVEFVWETVRLRRYKAALMNSCAGEGMRKVLMALRCEDPFELAAKWFERDPETVAEVEAGLAKLGLGVDAAMAQTLRIHLAEIEGMDRLLRSAEARRNAALHEIERHRAQFAAALRQAAEAAEKAAAPIEEAEFEVVQSVQTGQYPAAMG